MTEPQTEAGRQMMQRLAVGDAGSPYARSALDAILAIEAQARHAALAEALDADVRTVVERSSPYRNCAYSSAFRAPCVEVNRNVSESWCPFCQAHARLSAILDAAETP